MGVTLIRLKGILIGRAEDNCTEITEGLDKARWHDTDPWVVHPIPAGETNIYQHLRPPQIEGEISFYSIGLICSACNNQEIDDEGNVAIEGCTAKKHKIDYFALKAETQGKEERTYVFTDTRFRTLGIESLSEDPFESKWKLTFYARACLYCSAC